MSLSKAYYIDALQGYQVLEVLEAGKYQGVIAKVYSQLANDIERWDDKPKAEMHLRKAIDICVTQLDKGVTDSIYEVELGRAYNRLGSMLINEKGRRDEARTLLQQALKIRKRLMKEDFLTYSADVAETYSHLGSIGRNEKEEKNLICKALNIYRVLDSKMPGTYIIKLAMTCSELSNLLYFRNMGNKVEIERAYRETIDVFRRMDDEHLGAISSILTWEYWHLGSIISADSNRRSEAKDLYQEALDVLFRLEEQYPGKFASNIARIYLLFLELISSDKDLLVEAEHQHRKAVKIFRRWSHNFTGLDAEDVLKIYICLGELASSYKSQVLEEDRLYRDALKICQQLEDETPGKYTETLSNINCKLDRLTSAISTGND